MTELEAARIRESVANDQCIAWSSMMGGLATDAWYFWQMTWTRANNYWLSLRYA